MLFGRQRRNIIVKVNAVGINLKKDIRPLAGNNAHIAGKRTLVDTDFVRRNLYRFQRSFHGCVAGAALIGRLRYLINLISQPAQQFLQIIGRVFGLQRIGKLIIVGKHVAGNLKFRFAGQRRAQIAESQLVVQIIGAQVEVFQRLAVIGRVDGFQVGNKIKLKLRIISRPFRAVLLITGFQRRRNRR